MRPFRSRTGRDRDRGGRAPASIPYYMLSGITQAARRQFAARVLSRRRATFGYPGRRTHWRSGPPVTRFADRGEFVAKGFEEPLQAYEVSWPK